MQGNVKLWYKVKPQTHDPSWKVAEGSGSWKRLGHYRCISEKVLPQAWLTEKGVEQTTHPVDDISDQYLSINISLHGSKEWLFASAEGRVYPASPMLLLLRERNTLAPNASSTRIVDALLNWDMVSAPEQLVECELDVLSTAC